MTESPRIELTHAQPITFEEVDNLKNSVRIVGGLFVTEIPLVRDIEEGDIATRYYRRMFSRPSTPGTSGVTGLLSDSENALTCYFLRDSTLEDGENVNPDKLRYIGELGTTFVKSESFGVGSPLDANQPYDGFECEP